MSTDTDGPIPATGPTTQLADAAAERARRQARIAELKRPDTYGGRSLECDLVMKGGITSGVVYPLLVSELATTYRFRNIGGTSAGAIAAAAAAAASVPSDGSGYAKLSALPDRLGTELASLFRPQRDCRRLHRVLIAAIAKRPDGTPDPHKPWKLIGALLAFLWSWRGAALLIVTGLPMAALAIGLTDEFANHWVPAVLWLFALAVAAFAGVKWAGGRRLIAFAAGVVAAAMVTLAVVAGGRHPIPVAAWLVLAVGAVGLAAAVAMLFEAGRVIPANDYGLVGGSAFDTHPAKVEPLSIWLDTMLQELAGLGRDDAPLTFADLRSGPGVNLALLTTCLSKGRTYYLPYDLDAGRESDDRFYFDPLELRRSLPDRVIAYLCAPDDAALRAQAVQALARGERPGGAPADSPLDHAVWPLRPLPDVERLPVVMATRMSLSFPLLISAVPLRCVDWTLHANQAARDRWDEWFSSGKPDATKPTQRIDAERCWFSDGGIISNFPVHLFDAALPGHPTFGVNLRGFHPDKQSLGEPASGAPESAKIYRPTNNIGGTNEWWTRWRSSGFGALTGFAGALKTTMQNWSDHDQMRVPGYRDRVVHVSHNHAEGGLNLTMPAQTITNLGERGHAAAENLLAAFADPNARVTTNWRNHRWVRLRSTLALLSDAFAQIAARYDAVDPVDGASYRSMLASSDADAPSYGVTVVQRNTLIELVEGTFPAEPPAQPGVLGSSAAVAARSVAKTAAPSYKAPGPRPRLRILPGHDDGTAHH